MKSNQTRRLMVSVGVVIALGVALAWEYVHRQETSGRGGGVASLSPGMSTDNSPSAATGSAASAQYSPAPPAAEPEHAIAALRSEHAAAAPQVPSCADLAQGQIAWDYEGNKDWNSDNVQNLCRGTSNPTEPPRSFDRVMHGGINWGGGTRWQWQNALDLCAGTNDAEATINYFQARIGQGVQWPAAIRDGKYLVMTLGRWPSFRAKRTPGPLPLSL